MLAGQSFGYRAAVPSAHAREHLLASSGHDYLDYAPLILRVCAAAVTLGFIAARHRRVLRARALGGPPSQPGSGSIATRAEAGLGLVAPLLRGRALSRESASPHCVRVRDLVWTRAPHRPRPHRSRTRQVAAPRRHSHPLRSGRKVCAPADTKRSHGRGKCQRGAESSGRVGALARRRVSGAGPTSAVAAACADVTDALDENARLQAAKWNPSGRAPA